MLFRPPGRLPAVIGTLGLLLIAALLAVGTEGAALLVLFGGLVALPATWKGRERLAFWAWTLGGAALLVLALIFFSCLELDRATTRDPLWVQGNHETGFMIMLVGLGVALPGAIVGWILGSISRVVVREQRSGAIDAVDQVLWVLALAGALAGDVIAVGFRSMSLHVEGAILALPALSALGLAAVGARGLMRHRRLSAAYAGQDERLRVEEGPGEGDAPPITALPEAELGAVLVEVPASAGDYRHAAPEPRALARVPRSPGPLLRRWRTRRTVAIAAAVIQSAVVALLFLSIAKSYGWLR